jgi:hypothetical protein
MASADPEARALRAPRACALLRAALLGLALVAVASTLGGEAAACDICAIYTAAELGPTRTGPRIGVAEQFSYFSTWKEGSTTVPNPGERLQSSITQVFAGYGLTPRIEAQVNLPIIARWWRRVEEGSLTSGSESGIGDLSALARVIAFDTVGERGLLRFSLLGGLKFPTGNPDRLEEESAEDHGSVEEPPDEDVPHEHDDALGHRSAVREVVLHNGESHDESGIHGHDLALGTGSVDGVVGGDLFASYDRFFWTTSAQYVLRTEGAFGYRYANELTWLGGPGYYVYLDDDMTVGAQAVLTGETKGKDTLDGVKLDDTGITALYVGPSLRVSWGTSLAGEIIADLPVIQNVTSLQIVPDYRIRGAIVWRF